MQKSRVFYYSYSGSWDIFDSKAVKEWYNAYGFGFSYGNNKESNLMVL